MGECIGDAFARLAALESVDAVAEETEDSEEVAIRSSLAVKPTSYPILAVKPTTTRTLGIDKGARTITTPGSVAALDSTLVSRRAKPSVSIDGASMQKQMNNIENAVLSALNEYKNLN